MASETDFQFIENDFYTKKEQSLIKKSLRHEHILSLRSKRVSKMGSARLSQIQKSHKEEERKKYYQKSRYKLIKWPKATDNILKYTKEIERELDLK